MHEPAFTSINPATGLRIADYRQDDSDTIAAKLGRLSSSWTEWAGKTVHERAACIQQLADALERDCEALAQLITAEMGKPIRQARAEVEKCALLCRHNAMHGVTSLQPQTVDLDGRKALIRFDPQGVILAIMPWNFPFWQVIRFAVPVLLSGNAVAIKPATSTCGCAIALLQLMHQTGITACDCLFTDEPQTAEIMADKRITGISLTGSREAGRSVAAQAGRHLKKCVLELGGCDPYLVLADADLTLAAEKCVASRFNNSGQTCIAAKRWIVVDAVYDEFRQRVITLIKALVSGNPAQDETAIGPIARADLRERLHRQVRQSITAGASRILGGIIPPGDGFYYPPTLLEGVEPGMPAFDDELFGPVASLIRAADEVAAIRLANHSSLGLGAAIFSADRNRAMTIAARLEAGNIAINDSVSSDPRLPFGGIKESGYGRELGAFGMMEFVNIKTVVCGRASNG
ncbi:NAD-dependent succinate-semialdehyde dehydrogenase [Mariprofundus erugo]|uniref:NAD-dependent succinate-semialdehyde dehydrogenase n=1 Tax=Mariprofundus erugo TaxID=2528639 RepID=UPI0010FD0734|nr:NAD-dependent succinate-semialdehyde dehydrogenase [Mariprofundus erugo]TLS75815.1 NAD-dependent succinate-semialdehyde dehydrogenase [Mariprofundus erugo]